jgi:hypothetical protein
VTSMRFCQSQPELFDANGNRCPVFDCLAPANIKTSQLAHPEPSSPDPTLPWHAVRVGKQTRFGLLPPVGQDLQWDYGRTVDANTWFFESDNARWIAGGLIPLPNDYPQCTMGSPSFPSIPSGTCLSGTFWLSGNTSVGAVERGESPEQRSEYANYHLSMAPDVARVYCLIHPFLGTRSPTRAASTSAAFGFGVGEVL